jgi:hypothetical protein
MLIRSQQLTAAQTVAVFIYDLIPLTCKISHTHAKKANIFA